MRLLLIDKKTLSSGCAVGDVVGVYPDKHDFSKLEKEIFRIVNTPLTAEESDAIRPEYAEDAERPLYDLRYVDGKLVANG